MAEARESYQPDVAAVRVQLPETLDVLVPTGMTSHWLHALDWPAWAWTGTSLQPGTSLPHSVRLIDDLQLIANMLDGVGAERLLRMMLEWSRFPAPARTTSLILAAPNLGEALDLTTAWTNRLHPLMRVSLERKGELAVLRVFANPGLGQLAPFLAAAALLFWHRLLEMFFLNEPSTREPRAQICLESAFLAERLEPDLCDRLASRLEAGSGDDRMLCPTRLLTLG